MKTGPAAKVVLIVFVIVGMAWAGLSLIKSQVGSRSDSQEDMQLVVGATLPDFTLNRMDGGRVLASELQGKVVMLNFWASWCEACMVEMPSIHKLWSAYKDRGLVVAAVTVDENPEAVVPKVNKQLGFSLPVYTDTEGDLSNLFDVHAIPFTAILDENRRILHLEAGERDWFSDTIRSSVEKWLGRAH